MTNKRIKELADFFYSSNSAVDVPCRIALTSGMGGRDIEKFEFKELMEILNSSKDLKKDLKEFY